MPHERQKKMTVQCQISGKTVPLADAVPADLIRGSLVEILRKEKPDLDMNGYVSLEELGRARRQYAENLAESDLGELAELKKEVAESLLKQEALTQNVDAMFEQKASTGEKIADKVAAFGGSWTFIIIFGFILFTWMGINTFAILSKPFDPFPFIFLNLILSCLAAIQAPVIMMSQNRQETKDRLRGENDYKVNLKAELEIQHINEKIDKLINDQWKHLLEIQEMQMDMIEEMRRSR